MINRLIDSGIGCNVLGVLINAIGYADDLSLLCPTAKGLQQLISICEEYGNEFDVNFNLTKSECILFRNKKNCNYPIMTLCNKELKWKETVECLGHKITYNLDDDIDIVYRRNEFYSKFNDVFSDFYFVDELTLVKLLKAHCCTYFGAVTYDFMNCSISSLNNSFKVALRKIWNVPRETHSNLILSLSESCSVHTSIYKRYVNLYNRVIDENRNMIIDFFFKLGEFGFVRTVTGRNLNFLKRKFGDDLISNNIKDASLSQQELNILDQIKELIDVRKYFLIDLLTKNEIQMILDFICTM